MIALLRGYYSNVARARREERQWGAQLAPEPEVTEPGAAERLDFATVGYGVGNWHRDQGREAEATALFEQIVAAGEWPAFGHLAAEAELARR